ncbi:uncharacterized protein LOC122090126, partial [Macadamia integrifolia]|uniref:uncharacterized protein LOC122090126 n=1 Tax=Macadamia integrifolia TaxID=60698 RepID=UPI001C4F6BE2
QKSIIRIHKYTPPSPSQFQKYQTIFLTTTWYTIRYAIVARRAPPLGPNFSFLEPIFRLWCSISLSGIRYWLSDYDKIQDAAVILIYIQIGCALVGSLGAMYNGVLLINLAIALFALVAIESSSQRLGRTYAVLLFCAILLDISWLVLCAGQIWNISHKLYETFLIFSVKLSLSMQIVGFSLRLASSLLWIQMYRLGVSSVDNAASQEADFDLRNSFVNPSAHSMAREISHFDSTLGGSIYDPAFYSSLFEDARDNGYQMVEPVQRQAWDFGGNGKAYIYETPC